MGELDLRPVELSSEVAAGLDLADPTEAQASTASSKDISRQRIELDSHVRNLTVKDKRGHALRNWSYSLPIYLGKYFVHRYTSDPPCTN